MKLLSIGVIILSLLSQECYADLTILTSEDVQFMNIGDKASFSGYLISPDKVSKIRDNAIDLQSKTRVIGLMEDESVLMTARLKNSQDESETLSKRLQTLKDDSVFGKIGYFILGALVTTGVAYGVSKTIR